MSRGGTIALAILALGVAIAVVWVHDMTNLLADSAVPSPSAPLADRLAAVAGQSTLRLTHRGRKTGTPYEVTIWFAVDGETIFLPTMDRHRQWVRNVGHTPAVELQIGPERFAGTVTPIADQPTMHRVHELLTGKYWTIAALDRGATVIGRDPRTRDIDLGGGGLFRVELQQ